MEAVAEKLFTVEEYLALELGSELRHEFVDGLLIDMAGESKIANIIAGNLFVSLKLALKGKPFQVFNHDVKVNTVPHRRYRYPDVMVASTNDAINTHIVFEPILLAEITSESTIETDYHAKLHEYSSLLSVEYYLIVSQKEPVVELYRRNGEVWEFTFFDELSDTIELPKLALQLSLSDLYEGIF